MHSADLWRRALGLSWVVLVLAGCASHSPSLKPVVTPETEAEPSSARPAISRPVEPKKVEPRLPAPEAVRTRAELQRQVAQRLIAANPGQTYTHKAPPVLLAVPVFRVDLNADGSIRRIEVLREPRQAPETIQLAREAIERAAPFGNVKALPSPWFFTESFLFDDARRFKPRSLE